MPLEQDVSNDDGLAFEHGLNGLYDSNGITFRYPENWILSQQNHENEFTVSVNSPNTAFWSVFLFKDHPNPKHVIETATETLRTEYDEIDLYPTTAKMCERETVARDIEFVCLELINSAFLRAFETDEFTVFVMFQANDAELESVKDVMNSICASLKFVQTGTGT